MEVKRNLITYMAGRLISYIGTGIQQIALPLYILDLTHSGAMMALFSVLCIIPNLIAAPFAGIWGDRKNRKYIMIITDYVRGILILILGLLAMNGSLNIAVLFGSQIIVSVMDSFFGASSSALLPELLPEDRLMKAMSLRGGVDAVSMIIGPALGGAIYGFLGISAVFYINGTSFILSGIAAMLMTYTLKTQENGEITTNALIKENTEVLSFIKENKGLMQLFSFVMILNLFLTPVISIVMAYIIKKGMGFTSQQYGYFMAAFTVGMLLGNIALGLGMDKIKAKIIMQLSMILQVALLIVFAVIIFPDIAGGIGAHSWKLFIILSLVVLLIGAANGCLNTPLNTNLQQMVPNKMRARFFAILGVVCQVTVPIGSVMYGLLLDKLPYYYILLAVSLITTVITLIFIMSALPEVYEPAAALEN